MSKHTITVDDIVAAHNKTSTGFDDLVRWHTSVMIGAIAMIISSSINQAMRTCEACLFITSIIFLALSVALLTFFLYHKILLGYKKAQVLAPKINEAYEPIKVSVPKCAMWSLWFGYVIMLIGFVFLVLFVGVRVCDGKAREYSDVHLPTLETPSNASQDIGQLRADAAQVCVRADSFVTAIDNLKETLQRFTPQSPSRH